MPSFATDQTLLYNNGVWGELGYAVANFGNDPTTLNVEIGELVEVIGRNLQAIMHSPDADLRTPPSINTITKIHRLVIRSRQILAGRAVAPGTPNLEPIHSAPAPQDFRIFPVPFFHVRNVWMKTYAGYILAALSEAMQHTENRRGLEISTTFAGTIGQYLQRVYRRMSTELLLVPAEMATDPTFVLNDAQLASYDPGKFFTSTEMIDRVPALNMVPTEDDLAVLTEGIPATKLVNLVKYPSGSAPDVGQVEPQINTQAQSAPAGIVTSASVPAFPPAPGV